MTSVTLKGGHLSAPGTEMCGYCQSPVRNVRRTTRVHDRREYSREGHKRALSAVIDEMEQLFWRFEHAFLGTWERSIRGARGGLSLRSKGNGGNVAMPRKVLFVESSLGSGGSAFSLLRLVKSLDQTRYQAHVVVFHDSDIFQQIRSLGIPVHTIPFFQLFGRREPKGRGLWTWGRNYCSVYGNLAAEAVYDGIRLARYVRREQIDVVHLNNGLYENVSGAVAAHLARIPCVSHVRGTVGIPKIEKYIAPFIAAIITLNHRVFEEYALMCGREKVRLIRNGVDLDAFENPDPERIRREFDIAPGAFAVGTFVRLVDGKGVAEFITTASRVSREHGDARFFVIGHDPSKNGHFEASMRKLAGEAGLGDRLTFTGWRNDRIDIMAAMDVVLQISTTFPEGMSLAPLEAMALGKPVIVTNIPGYEFCVDDEKTGFVVALTEKVLILARDNNLARRMGQEGYRKARSQFDVRLTARQVEKLYDQVLDHHERGRRGRVVPVCEGQ